MPTHRNTLSSSRQMSMPPFASFTRRARVGVRRWTGVFDWPGTYSSSPHVPEMSGIGTTIRSLLEMVRRNG